MNILKQYLEEGGNLLIIQGEQGDTKNNTNLNNFLKDYGISFHGDSVVRTAFYKYFHPKQCLIDTLTVHPGFLKTIKNVKKKKKIDLMQDDDIGQDDDDEDCPLKIVYPFGQSIDIDPKKTNLSVLFTSGKITFLPTYFLYLLSFSLTATAVSPNKVSGLVVATSKYSSLSSNLYFI